MNLDKRLLAQVREAYIPMGLTILLGIAAAVLVVLQARSMSTVIGGVFLEGKSLAQVWTTFRILLIVILLQPLVTWGSEVTGGAAAMRIKTILRERLFKGILASNPEHIAGERSGELVRVLVDGVEALDVYFSQYLPQLALAAVVPLILLLFVLRIDLLSGIVLLVTAPLIPLFMVLIGTQAQKETRKQWNALSRMTAYFMDVLAGLKTLKTFGRSREQTKIISDVSERYRRVTMRVLRVTFLSALVLEMVATLSTAIVAVEIGLRLLQGRIAFEQALFILLLSPEFYLPLRLLGTRFHAGMAGIAAAERIFELLERQTANSVGNSKPLPGPGGSTLDTAGADNRIAIQGDVQLDNVHFSYADRPAVLDGISMSIEKGQRVALVGPSGAGKSTIASLLLRFIQPDAGVLRVAGEDIASIDPGIWRANIAWVPQGPYLFHATIAENIRLARPEASFEEVVQAARLAMAHEFISRLPDKYDTMIGEWGEGLSAGQGQRVALARAFLKDAPLLILDEPTANLDPRTEAELQLAMNQLMEGRTVLVIAHRLNTTISADRIYVIDRGRIVQRGTHAELAVERGLYRRMISSGRPVGGRERITTPDDEDWGDALEINIPQKTGQLFATVMPGHYSGVARADTDLASLRESGSMAGTAFAWSNLKRLVSLVSPYLQQVALSVLAGFATIASGIGLLGTSAYLISAAALQPSIAELQVAIVGVRFFGISRGLFRYIERYLSHQVTFHLLARLRTWFYSSLEPLAPARLMAYHSGDLMARIHGDIESLQNFYVRALAPPLVAALVSLALGLFMWQFAPSLALVLLLFLALAGLGVPVLTHLLSRKPGRLMVAQQARLNELIVEGIQGMPELVAYGLDTRQIDKVNAVSESLNRLRMKMANITGLQSGLTGLLSNLCMLVVLVLAIPMVLEGQIAGVALAVVALVAYASFEAIQPISQAAVFLGGNLAAAQRLHEIIDADPDVQDPPAPIAIPESIDLRVDKVSFRYPASGLASGNARESAVENCTPALEQVSFCLLAGKKTALVGASGSGKSTLINLLMRYWEYKSGNIYISGEELRRYDSYALRDRYGALEQGSYLFNASVRENLLIARPNATRAQIDRAARAARIDEFIARLPDGFDTLIGERGLQLSGGERQRLLIARALLRDAVFIIMDEPTANLDPLSEGALLDTLQAEWSGCTVLVATHRLVGLEQMDEILVLDGGRIVERGTQGELLAKGGYYQRMWALQHQELIESL